VVSALLGIVTASLLVMTVVGVHGPVRFTFGMLLGFVIPGWCLVGWLRLNDPFLEASLAIGLSLAIIMILAELMLSIHWWHLAVLEDILCGVCLVVLVGMTLQKKTKQ
jgi:uncharacterized membrane protein